MHIFISAGEPSGDLHGANLAHEIRRLDPSCQLTGLGGPLMRGTGVELHYPLAEHAVMGFIRVLKVIPDLSDLLDRVAAQWQWRRPDAVVLIDYPGYHWWVAARAKAMGIPVVSFVPPQIWGWASWRVRKVRAYFDHVLCSLPFEEPWYHERGVPQARYIGHPFFDELPKQQLDAGFLAAHRGGPIVSLLPGSRTHEVRSNLETLVGAARLIHAARPDVRFLIACFRADHQQWIDDRLSRESLPATTLVGRTPEAIELAEACIAVSGSVSLELLYRRKPTVVVYRTSPFYAKLFQTIKNVPYMSLVNLLAERELYPEYLIGRDEPDQQAKHVLRWLNDSDERGRVVAELDVLKTRYGAPGACRRAAEFIAERCSQRRAA